MLWWCPSVCLFVCLSVCCQCIPMAVGAYCIGIRLHWLVIKSLQVLRDFILHGFRQDVDLRPQALWTPTCYSQFSWRNHKYNYRWLHSKKYFVVMQCILISETFFCIQLTTDWSDTVQVDEGYLWYTWDVLVHWWLNLEKDTQVTNDWQRLDNVPVPSNVIWRQLLW